MRRLLLPALLLLGAACSSDDDGDGDADEPTATSAPTEEAMDDATAEPTEEAMDEAGVLAAVDGITCTGSWTNITFGSTGSFEALFAADADGATGTVTITLGGNVFGAAGGTVVLPLAANGSSVETDAAADFLGNAKLTFDSDGNATSAVFEAPPAFGNAASKATLEDFAFDGETLTTRVLIDFGDGSSAESKVESACA